MEMKNARLYARVSTDEQRKKEQSVPDQLEALKEYCQEHNYNIKGIYHDDGISAATIDKRKDFCRMLDDLQQNEVILFTKLDRFSRDLLDGNLLLKRFAPLNISFKAILEPDIDVTTADGKFRFDLMVSLAERERKIDSERILFSFERKVARGEFLGGRLPIGYIKDNKRAVIDPERIGFVKDIFDTMEIEQNTFRVMKAMNHKYGLNKDKKYYYRKLIDQRYTGVYREKTNVFPQIITPEQFNNVQSILHGRYIKRGPSRRDYIFSGLLLCSECGRKLAGSATSGKYKIYKCSNLQKGEKMHCCFAEKKLEKKILPKIMPLLQKYLLDLEASEAKVSQNRDIIQISRQKINRLQDLYIDGKIDKDTFDRKYADLNEIITAEERKSNIVSIQEAKQRYTQLLDMDIENIYPTLNDKEKRKLWHSFIERIVIKSYDEIDIFLL